MFGFPITQTLSVQASNGNFTYMIPNVGMSSNVVLTDGAQTLSNKTLVNSTIDGPVLSNVVYKSGTYTITTTDYVVFVDTSSVAGTINLPNITSSVVGRCIYIVDYMGNASMNNITIVPNGSQKINLQDNALLNQNFSAIQICASDDGTNIGWIII